MIELTTELIALMILVFLHEARRTQPRLTAASLSLRASAAGGGALALLSGLELLLHGLAR